MDWKSVKAVHVTKAYEPLLSSADPRAKARGLVVIYKDKQLPAKTILRTACCIANNIPSETKLKFASGEGSIQIMTRYDFYPSPQVFQRHGSISRYGQSRFASGF